MAMTKKILNNGANSGKKVKRTQSIIAKQNATKQRLDYDWRNKYTFYNQKSVPLCSLETLADLIINTVKTDPKIMTFNKVLALCDVQASSMVKFLVRSEKLRKAKGYAMFIIGINREEAALNRSIDGNIMKHMQGRYDPSWKLQEIYHSELRKNNQAEHTTKIVVLEKFAAPPSDSLTCGSTDTSSDVKEGTDET